MHKRLMEAKRYALRSATESLKFARERLTETKRAMQDLSLVEVVLKILLALGLTPRDMMLSPINGGEGVSVDFYLDVDEMMSFKSPAIQSAIAALSEYVGECKSRDYANSWDAERIFSFRSSDRMIAVALHFSVSSTGAACRKVKIGTKLVEQDEYKIVCE